MFEMLPPGENSPSVLSSANPNKVAALCITAFSTKEKTGATSKVYLKIKMLGSKRISSLRSGSDKDFKEVRSSD